MIEPVTSCGSDASSAEPPSSWSADPNPADPCAVADGRLAEWARLPEWNDWRWQMQHRLRNVEALRECFPALHVPEGLVKAAEKFPLAITPYYAALIRGLDGTDPIFRMGIPQGQELADPAFLVDDPLEEDEDMPVPGLVHRYPDRALLLVTSTCAAYCRHCTRKRVAGMTETRIPARRLNQAVAYLAAHPEISDVILSGGDPFTLATEALDRILLALRSVPSVQILRIGTRTPVVMPMRITDELVAMLRRYHPVWVNTHFNHPNELTPAAAEACGRLVDAGIPVGNQSVLLRGVNDRPETIEALCRGLIRARVRPYYLFQCDLVRGVEHFRTPLARGIEIMEHLRGRVSGLAIPSFVVDAPHGGGKIPLLPNYIVATSPTHTVLRNSEGMLVAYPEPGVIAEAAGAAKMNGAAPGIADLASGRASVILPGHSTRLQRRRLKAACEADSAGL